MKSLVEFLNESLNKEEIKDLHACIKTVLSKIEINDYKSEKEYKDACEEYCAEVSSSNGDPTSLDIYDNVKQRLLNEYDFSEKDLDDCLETSLFNVIG